jgi:hypothetical protein
MKPLHTSVLSNNELYSAGQGFAEILKGFAGKDSFLSMLINNIGLETTNLGEALGRDRKSDYKEILDKLDTERDNAFLAMRDYITSCTRRRDKSVVEAASELEKLFEKHGWTLYSRGDADQTADLDQLINELKQNENLQHIKTIHAYPLLNDLEETHKNYYQTYNEKLDAEGKADKPTLTPPKRKLRHYLNMMTDCLEFLEINAPADDLHSRVSKIDELTTDLMTKAQARRTREENNDE